MTNRHTHNAKNGSSFYSSVNTTFLSSGSQHFFCWCHTLHQKGAHFACRLKNTDLEQQVYKKTYEEEIEENLILHHLEQVVKMNNS